MDLAEYDRQVSEKMAKRTHCVGCKHRTETGCKLINVWKTYDFYKDECSKFEKEDK